MDNEYIKKAIECIIFISDKPVTVDDLLHVFNQFKRAELMNLLYELHDKWNEMSRGIELVEVSGGFQFRTVSEFSEVLTNYNKEIKKFRLSKPALEVAAIIAYKQPVTRVEIEEIRGVDSSGVLGYLLDRRLIEITGRKEVIGRPFIYGTSLDFLETFGLRSLKDLPDLKEIEEFEDSFKDFNMNLQKF